MLIQVHTPTPLTWHEQEWMHETIPNLTPDHLNGVIQIIREAATPIGGGDIDVELDQLEMTTQRKLFRYVTKVRRRIYGAVLYFILFCW